MILFSVRQDNCSHIKDAGSKISVSFAAAHVCSRIPETCLCHLEWFTSYGACALETHRRGYRSSGSSVLVVILLLGVFISDSPVICMIRIKVEEGRCV